MESKSFSESWKDYTIRDKILLSSSIVPLIIFVFSLIVLIFFDWFPELISTTETCGNLYISYPNGSVSQIEGEFCLDAFVYAINPILLLISTISLLIFAFFYNKTDKAVSKMVLGKTPSKNSSMSVFSRIQYIHFLSFISIILVVFGSFIFLFPLTDEYYYSETNSPHDVEIAQYDCASKVNYVSMSCENRIYVYDFDNGHMDYQTFNDFANRNEEKVVETPSINPFSYLFYPNMIATLAFAYYSRNKNQEENPKFIEQSTPANTGISVAAASKLKEAKELLDQGIIDDDDFQKIKDEFLS
jgi:energy-coupling factor transporter transmembrane protein EcfT